MTLTVCIGSSGSGKTTFINDVWNFYHGNTSTTTTNNNHNNNDCVYIRQFHNMRPYITVSKIPNFDPTALPYWDIYQMEQKDQTIKAGGTMAGQFIAGLSGGQRKLLLFELVYQRTKQKSNGLLIIFDEPFAGVTDDFIPFIMDRLDKISRKHNVLLVTNDHIDSLTEMADNVLVVSTIERTKVQINDKYNIDRHITIEALATSSSTSNYTTGTNVGETKTTTTTTNNDNKYYYHGKITRDDIKFFVDIEILGNRDLLAIGAFTIFSFGLFLVTFWESDPNSIPLVLIGGSMISFFCVHPYILSLVEWRIAINEEGQALMHTSQSMTKLLKTILTLSFIFIVSWIEYGCVNLVMASSSNINDSNDEVWKFLNFWMAMFIDSISLTFTLIVLGIYTDLSFQAVQILGSLPFLLLIFLSTTFSPGAGVPVVKELRYLYSRFYFWCMLPTVKNLMEDCPESSQENTIYMTLTGFLFVFVFGIYKFIIFIPSRWKRLLSLLFQVKNNDSKRNSSGGGGDDDDCYRGRDQEVVLQQCTSSKTTTSNSSVADSNSSSSGVNHHHQQQQQQEHTTQHGYSCDDDKFCWNLDQIKLELYPNYIHHHDEESSINSNNIRGDWSISAFF